MTLGELIKTCRRELADDSGGAKNGLVKDWQLIDYANDAENEACRRASLISDSSTTAICTIPVLTGVNIYDLDPRIIYVQRIKLLSKSQPLGKYTFKELDEFRVGWETSTGTVEAIVTGMDTGKLQIYRIPIADDTIKLTVTRIPLVEMLALADTPEINQRFHRSLIFWMKFKAYDNQDSEIYDPKLSDKNYHLFEQEFGVKPGATSEIFDEINTPFDSDDVGWQ
jgi:hypothetical protein